MCLLCCVAQGTLYPDVIESCPPPGSGQKHSHTIKSHHNVGGLPKDLQFSLIEPFRELFKDEVGTGHCRSKWDLAWALGGVHHITGSSRRGGGVLWPLPAYLSLGQQVCTTHH